MTKENRALLSERINYTFGPVDDIDAEDGHNETVNLLAKKTTHGNTALRSNEGGSARGRYRSLFLQSVVCLGLVLAISDMKTRWYSVRPDEFSRKVTIRNDTMSEGDYSVTTEILQESSLNSQSLEEINGVNETEDITWNYTYREGWPKAYRKDFSEIKQKPAKQLCFVHIGKTAGSTLSCYLGFLNSRCKSHKTLDAIPMAPGILPTSTTHMSHVGWDDCKKSHISFDYYLFVLRDPLKRMQSWFTYEHPMTSSHMKHANETRLVAMKELYIDCKFDTLEQLAIVGLSPTPPRSEIEATCQKRARQAITGTRGFIKHNKFNFDFYYKSVEKVERPYTETSSKIVVIRTEHLYEDWKGVEEDVLNGPRGLNVTFEHRNESNKRPQDQYLSLTAQSRICSLLCNEIKVYKRILRHAINLSEDDVSQSALELSQSCPVEAAPGYVCKTNA